MVARDGQDLQNKSTTGDGSLGPDAQHQKLMHDTWSKTTEQTALRTTDQATGTKTTGDQVVINPSQLVQKCQAAGQEIASYANKNLNDKMPELDQQGRPTGRLTDVTYGQRINDLKIQINTDSQNAITAADTQAARGGADITKRIENNLNQLDTAAQALGLNDRAPNFQDQLAQAFQNATVDQIAALQNVEALAKAQRDLQAERFAPATTRLSYALLKADGFTDDPAGSLDSIRKTGMPKASKEELADAFMMMQTAGRTDKEVFYSQEYGQVSASVNGQYAQTQQERGQKIVAELTKADSLSRSGDVKGAEENYKLAMEDTKGVDQKWLAAQLRIPANAQNPDIAQALVGMLTNVKEAKLQYANFLNGQSRYSEALPLALQVQADTPELAQQDQSFNKVLNTATFGNTMSVGDLQAHQQKFAQFMQDHKWDDASKELDALTKNYQDTKAALDKNGQTLGTSKDDVTKQLAELEKKKDTMDQTEYKIEQGRLQNELKVFDANAQAGAGLDKQGNYLTYLQGVLAYSKDDKATAHALFEQIKGDPDIAGNKQLNLDQLLDATKHQNWFQRNWHALATIGAVAAGIGVGIAVACVTGPGGIAAGIGTTGAIMAAVGGGAVAGGLAYGGIKGATLGFDQVGWGDIKDGAITGGLSAVTTVAGPLLGGARTAAAGAEVLGGSGAVEATSLSARVVGTLGVRGTGALTGASLAVGKEGYQVAFQGKSWGDAGKSLLWEAPLFAAGGSMAAAKGITFSTLGLNPTTLKIGAGLAGTKEAAEMAFNGKSLKDATGSFILEAPLFAGSVGMAGNAATKVLGPGGALTAETLQPTLVASSKIAAGLGGLGAGLELSKQAYNDYSPVALPVFGRPEHIALNPNDEMQNQEIWMRYGQINPNLYHAPDATVVPVQDTTQGQAQPAKPVTPYTRMTQEQIDAQRNKPIQDEPVN